MTCFRMAILDFHNLFLTLSTRKFMIAVVVLGNMRRCFWLCSDFMQRFIPAEFGADPTKVQICDMDYGFYEKKIEIRHSIEREGIPHTYICCNFFMRYLLPSLVQPGLDAPPRDEIKIFGEGNTKGLIVMLLYSFSLISEFIRKYKRLFYMYISLPQGRTFLCSCFC